MLEFWFGDVTDPENVKHRGKLWFASTPDQDRALRQQFSVLHKQAEEGHLDDWADRLDSRLALIVLLDQFTRNLYRGTALAFSNDARALALARNGIKRAFDRSMHVVERAFLYMPYQHSEDAADQARSLELFKALIEDSREPFQTFAESSYQFAVLHKEIIDRFGRFPHRNKLLGRDSTEEEKQYLEQDGRKFGQG